MTTAIIEPRKISNSSGHSTTSIPIYNQGGFDAARSQKEETFTRTNIYTDARTLGDEFTLTSFLHVQLSQSRKQDD